MKNKHFILNITKYFMDFLETNFRKKREPKRIYQSKNNNILMGINLQRFDGFKSELLQLIIKNNNSTLELNLKKDQHTVNISTNILDLITKYCENLNQEQLDKINNQINEKANVLIDQFFSDAHKARDEIIEMSTHVLYQSFIHPLIEIITNPLELERFSIIDIESELRNIFTEALEEHIVNFVNISIATETTKNLDISSILSIEKIKSNVTDYFEALKTNDLFFEVENLLRSREMLDKQEFYIYLFDIKFNNSVYPLFYIPITINKNAKTKNINIKLEESFYINKKAIEFLVQQINQEQNRKGKINNIADRVISFNKEQNNIGLKLQNIFNDILNYLQLDKTFEINNLMDQVFKSQNISVTNNCYFSLFDKSDEAIINDYEEMINLLQNDSEIGKSFCNLIGNFVKKDPVSSISTINTEFSNTKTSKKLTHISPIPLNEEQKKIINALKKKDVKYITVEGPPGTGKSHTITAIVCNAILANKNTLVLSDKKEALDVVEDKIKNILNTIRGKKNFQNSILRLGKTGNTYNKILTANSISNIRTQYNIAEKNKNITQNKINDITKNLQNNIDDEVNNYSAIQMEELIKHESLNKGFQGKDVLKIDKDELYQDNNIIDKVESMRAIGISLNKIFVKEKSNSLWNNLYKNSVKNPEKSLSLIQFKKIANNMIDINFYIKAKRLNVNCYNNISGMNFQNIGELKNILHNLKQMDNFIFSFYIKSYFNKNKVLNILSKLHQNYCYSSDFKFHGNRKSIFKLVSYLKNQVIPTLQHAIGVFNTINKYIDLSIDFTVFRSSKKRLINTFLSQKIFESDINTLSTVYNDLVKVEQFIKDFPQTSKNLNLKNGFSIIKSQYVKMENSDFDQVINFYKINKKITKSFKSLPQYDYHLEQKKLEELYTTQMAHSLDSSVINFYDSYRSKAKTLQSMIKSKKKVPKAEFKFLQQAFPCMISGIRDYAEVIPLVHELFDIVIIDEASQVNIAQALPALLRAKQVIVFGDKKQFSNIKSAHAKSDTNNMYIKKLKDTYTNDVNISESELERLSKFNIKTSALEFFDYISNYNIMLKKHFRSCRELISYSNKYFYNNDLQVIKIREKLINEVIEFNFLQHDGKLDTIKNTNLLEVNAVIKYLEGQLDNINNPPTIGIITPHTAQQQRILEAVSRHPRCNDFYEIHKLKIMTFDTCQGEERDHIVYSMVASSESDKLRYIFIKDLKTVDVDEDNKIRAQRLNVGFSRAKQKIVFICSKPITEYKGSIGEALRHFDLILQNFKTFPTIADVDSKSPMEQKVLHWIQDTNFFKNNMENIKLNAQFNIGEYLKQIDPTYNKPSYVCDFLLRFINQKKQSYNIIIEYDGFKEHFTNLKKVNKFNYEKYMKTDDIYRQKVLEDYDYKFLRINKFIIGDNPVETLDKRLKSLVKYETFEQWEDTGFTDFTNGTGSFKSAS